MSTRAPSTPRRFGVAYFLGRHAEVWRRALDTDGRHVASSRPGR